MNKEELLKAIEQKRQEIWPTDTGEMKPATVPNNLESGWLNALYWMENLINSLPSEQPSGDFKEEFNNFCVHGDIRNPNFEGPFGYDDIRKTAIHFADWQKEQMMKSAIDAKIVNDESSGCVVDCEQGCLVLEPHRYPIGQKLKILIVKEEQ